MKDKYGFMTRFAPGSEAEMVVSSFWQKLDVDPLPHLSPTTHPHPFLKV
jgi:hypothetical protein